jgi:alpha-tubulin suppressor-like RCC1 family protein
MAIRILLISIISFLGLRSTAQQQNISCGNEFFSVICDGHVWSWGNGGFGQFGNSSFESNMTSQMAVGLGNVVSIHTGENHAVALLDDGTVWAWGNNAVGQLGTGNTTDSSVPVQVSGLSNVKSVAAGRNFNMALLQDSTVYVWGLNQNGELGNGTFENALSPIILDGVPPVASIHAAYFTGFAILSDSTLMVWGSNLFGVAGAGTANSVINFPTMVPNMTGVVSVDGGYASSAVLKGDGTLWTTGLNQWGQLGLGNFNSPFYSFQQVPTLNDIVSFRCGNSHMLAINSVGSIYGWGYNNYGQVGDGTLDNRHSPFLIDLPESVQEVNAFEWNSILLTESGNYYTWGQIAGGVWEGGNLISSGIPLLKEDVCVVSSIAESENHWQMSYYPNPAGSSVTIQSSNPDVVISEIQMHNLAGQLVYFQAAPIISDSMIHFGALPKGFYLITAVSNYGSYTEKLIVE